MLVLGNSVTVLATQGNWFNGAYKNVDNLGASLTIETQKRKDVTVMRKWIIVLGICILTIISLVAIAIGANNNQTNQQIQPTQEVQNINTSSGINHNDIKNKVVEKWKEYKINIKEPKTPAKLDEAQIIDKAKKLAPLYAQNAQETIAMYKIYTNDSIITPFPETNILPKDLPAWIITFHNTKFYRTGGEGMQPYEALGDYNIVLDPNTGEEIHRFWYGN